MSSVKINQIDYTTFCRFFQAKCEIFAAFVTSEKTFAKMYNFY